MTSPASRLSFPAMERLSDVVRRVGAKLQGADAAFSRVNTDTRKLEKGDVFVALKGEQFDGHEFVRRAGSLGAAGALVDHPIECELPQVVVPDTLRALQDYASSWRADFEVPVVAVTGSNGKTTTKQMLSSIFAARGPVLATQGNLNNHIGLPLTLLGLRKEHRTAVTEMGANHPGEIARLTEIARPNIGVVTQAGEAHLEGFGSRAGVAKAKGELFAGLGAGGVAVINWDDDYAGLWRELAGPASVITFGFDEDADVRAVDLRPYPHEAPTGTHFELHTPAGRYSVKLPLPGRHNVSNALAAVGCAVALGVDLEEIAAGLAGAQPASGRLTWRQAVNGARLLDDTYNANPSSLRAGLEMLVDLPGEHWLILGDMGELGPDTERLHFEAGRTARALGIQRLFALGPLAHEAAKGYGPEGRAFDDLETLTNAARGELSPQTVVLVKGSRASRMERVVAALIDQGRP